MTYTTQKNRSSKFYDKDSHFMQNYREMASYMRKSAAYFIPCQGIDKAYQAYENIKEAYNAGQYNSWEEKMCEKMGIPKE